MFFDEFDSIANQRDSEKEQITDWVVNQLLVELDGIQELKKTYVICATSRPDLIDKAIIRPGRID